MCMETQRLWGVLQWPSGLRLLRSHHGGSGCCCAAWVESLTQEFPHTACVAKKKNTKKKKKEKKTRENLK